MTINHSHELLANYISYNYTASQLVHVFNNYYKMYCHVRNIEISPKFYFYLKTMFSNDCYSHIHTLLALLNKTVTSSITSSDLSPV